VVIPQIDESLIQGSGVHGGDKIGWFKRKT